ncbi:hypothetical protein [Sandaracinus amylolyticus]|nr:hypothetical protein [Sandaracinus amylolyticus]
MRTSMVPWVALALAGCEGVLGGPEHDPTDPPAFVAPLESVTLLPFDVRLQRVADAVGVSTDDPILADLRAARLELGDHDYGAGVAPDLAWSARRMTSWARALRPVCASEAMRARYPALRDALEELAIAAYGRRATPEDYDAYDAALAEVPLVGDAQYRAMCIALLSSTELVAR